MSDDADSLEILEALAEIGDVGDFRLTEFMRQLGMNPTQPTIFYRRLIMEAREDRAYKKFLDDIIDENHKEIAKLNTDASLKDQEIQSLRARVSKLENEARHKMESLERERDELVATSSELQDKVWKYDALIQLLKGEIEPATLKVLSNLFGDAYMDTLSGNIEGRPPPDLDRLDSIRQKLRQDLRDILRIPKQELEEEMDTLQKENRELRERYQGLVDMLKRAYGGEGDRAH